MIMDSLPFLHVALLMFGVGVVGLLAGLALMGPLKSLAWRYGFLSHPGGHSRHDKSVPVLGGVAIYGAFLVATALFYTVFTRWPPGYTHPGMAHTVSLFLGATWVMLLGVADDRYNIGWKLKLGGELVGVGILLLGGHTIQNATLPFVGFVEFGWFGHALFALAVLTITNAVNLVDGVDGLAGGICFFAALVCGIIGLHHGDIFGAVVGFGVSGGLLAFLRHNFPPASIFMGDSGSLMLGFLLGTLATSSAAPSAGQRSGTIIMLLAPFLPFGVALLDVALSIIRRSVSGRRVFLPDTDHIHHRLMDKLGRPRAVVAILYAFSAMLSAITLTLVLGPAHGFYRAYVLLSGVVGLGLIVLVVRLYTRETLPRIWVNRPHMKYLASFIEFMSRKAQRTCDEEALLDMLEAGVRDLDFDEVSVTRHGQTVRQWRRAERLHPMAPRSEREKALGRGVLVRWVSPQHDSVSYQSYLRLAWDQFLRVLENRLKHVAARQDEDAACAPPSRSDPSS